MEGKTAPAGFDSVTEQLLFFMQAIFVLRWSEANIQSKKDNTNIIKFFENLFIPDKKTKEFNKSSPIPENTTEKPNTPLPMVPYLTISFPSIPSPPSSLVIKQVDIIKKKTLAQSNVKKSYAQASKANISSRVKNIL